MQALSKRFTLLMVVTLLLGVGTFADQITLKNGDRITGTIMNSDKKTLVIKTEAAGDVTVQWAAIEGISSAQPLHIGLSGGQVLVGPVKTENGRIEVATPTSGAVTASKDSIEVIRSDSGQAEYDAAMERLRHPHLLDTWSGLLDTGLSVTRGNSATISFSLAGKAIRQTDRDKITLYTTAIYGKNDNTSPSETIAHQIQGGVRGDVNITPRVFVFGATDFNYNALQHLDLQNVIDGGAGYHVIKTKVTTFDIFGGAGYNQEYFSAYSLVNATPPPDTLDFAAVTQKNAELLAGEELDTTLGKRTTVSENFTVYPNISGPSGYRFSFNSAISTKLNNWLGWQITVADNYLSNPPFGIKGNDFLLSTGLRLTFGKAAK
jgi:putative salt-induced outer membrane protein YdiY